MSVLRKSGFATLVVLLLGVAIGGQSFLPLLEAQGGEAIAALEAPERVPDGPADMSEGSPDAQWAPAEPLVVELAPPSRRLPVSSLEARIASGFPSGIDRPPCAAL